MNSRTNNSSLNHVLTIDSAEVTAEGHLAAGSDLFWQVAKVVEKRGVEYVKIFIRRHLLDSSPSIHFVPFH